MKNLGEPDAACRSQVDYTDLRYEKISIVKHSPKRLYDSHHSYTYLNLNW